MQESPQAQGGQEALRGEFAGKQQELQTQQAALKAKEDKLQKDGATMTEDQRTKAEKELRDGKRDCSRRSASTRTTSTRARTRSCRSCRTHWSRRCGPTPGAEIRPGAGRGVHLRHPGARHHAAGAGRAAGARRRAAGQRPRSSAAPAPPSQRRRRRASSAARLRPCAASMALRSASSRCASAASCAATPTCASSRVATLGSAGPGALSFLANPQLAGAAGAHARRGGGARCARAPPPVRRRCWSAANPYALYARIAALLHPEPAPRARRASERRDRCRARRIDPSAEVGAARGGRRRRARSARAPGRPALPGRARTCARRRTAAGGARHACASACSSGARVLIIPAR